MRLILSLILASAGQPLLAQATPASAPVNPRAIELFQRDWVLMDWGLRFHDPDRNATLSADEADAAAKAFKQMADTDGDGRVTTHEYRRAREFILARY